MTMPEDRIRADAPKALENREFVVYYQPQYNHSTKEIIGAEALVRWNHPEAGLLAPASFVPVLESCGLITRLDLDVFEQVCRFLAGCRDGGVPVVPVSFNVSMRDVEQSGFVAELDRIRLSFGIPVELVRVEITESFASTDIRLTQEAVRQLHDRGYLVEMDDFGSGYSSLNVLKDVPFDVIKLDMAFLRGTIGGRGGSIISSVVYMCRWLNTSLIAEGVETAEVADFMKSIGCEDVQGYLYSRPIPEEDFRTLLRTRILGALQESSRIINTLDPEKYWTPESLETLIFSSYVGGAAIIRFSGDDLSFVRVNGKYLKEIGMGLTESDLIRGDPWQAFDAGNRAVYTDMLRRAVASGEEEECETWRTYRSRCCGEERICLRASARMLCNFEGAYILHVMIRNITGERQRFMEVKSSDDKLRAASEHANLYAWEYFITTGEMHPCFRCMRDLGLPAVIKNYPDYVIDNGLFVPECADRYRDMMRRVDAGEDGLEGVFPLTAARVPFRVRYTIVRDAAGTPVKAFGSAEPVPASQESGADAGK